MKRHVAEVVRLLVDCLHEMNFDDVLSCNGRCRDSLRVARVKRVRM